MRLSLVAWAGFSNRDFAPVSEGIPYSTQLRPAPARNPGLIEPIGQYRERDWPPPPPRRSPYPPRPPPRAPRGSAPDTGRLPDAAHRERARYTYRVAISNHRLLPADDSTVTFRWKDYAHHSKCRTRALT